MTIYDRAQATAQRMITKYGAPAVLKRNTAGAYNPATGSATITTVVQPVQACVFDFDQNFIDGTKIRTGDKQAYLGAVGVAMPLSGDLLTWPAVGGVDYGVVDVKPLSPAGSVVVFYLLQIRGSA